LLYAFKGFPFRVWNFMSYGNFRNTPAVDLGNSILIGTEDDRFYKISYANLGTSGSKTVCEGGSCHTEEFAFSGLKEAWSYNLTTGVTSSAAVGNIDGIAGLESVFAAGSSLYAFDSSGKRNFTYTVGKTILSSPTLADLDGDGKLEVIFGSNEGRVYIINSLNRAVWHASLGSAVKTSPAVADLSGDGTLEFMVGTENGILYAFGSGRAVVIREANVFYQQAVAAFDDSDYNNTVEYVSNASSLYSQINYTIGLRMCENLRRMVSAEILYSRAVGYYNDSKLGAAADILADVSSICHNISYIECSDRADGMLKLIDADRYLLEAEYFYGIEDFANASAYGNEANNIYQTINHSAGVSRAEALLNKSATHRAANAYYGIGVSAYELNDSVYAAEYVSEALRLYERLNFTAGIEKANETLNKIGYRTQAGSGHETETVLENESKTSQPTRVNTIGIILYVCLAVAAVAATSLRKRKRPAIQQGVEHEGESAKTHKFYQPQEGSSLIPERRILDKLVRRNKHD